MVRIALGVLVVAFLWSAPAAAEPNDGNSRPPTVSSDADPDSNSLSGGNSGGTTSDSGNDSGGAPSMSGPASSDSNSLTSSGPRFQNPPPQSQPQPQPDPKDDTI